MHITSTPANSSSVVLDGQRVARHGRGGRLIVLASDEYRRTFTTSDGNRYRVTTITVYADGSFWAWAAQLTKKSQPYKNGMGLTMGGTEHMAELYGADILAVVTEAMALASAREVDHELAMAEDAGRSTYRPGQRVEAQFGPSGWTLATYVGRAGQSYRPGTHMVRTEEYGIMPAHPDKIRTAHGAVGHGGTPGDCAACHAEEYAPAIRQH